MRLQSACLLACSLSALLGLVGCGSISIAPSCPAELEIGKSGTVWANEINPGATPRYQWEAIPTDAGTFQDPLAATTTFQAAREGEVVLRLTAADGVFQVISECKTRVVAPGSLMVQLTATPASGTVGELFTLGCLSVGSVEATRLTIDQVSGPTVELSVLLEGLATFTPTQADTYVFRCIGADDAGRQSDPQQTTVNVSASGGRPPRPGRR